MIFINSPFAILDEAFRSLYPDKKYKACIEPSIKDDEGNRVFGFTQFSKGETPVIAISAELNIMDATEIFAHELAHVAAGEDVLVWFEYFRFGNYQELFQTVGISCTWRGKWSGFVNGSSGWRDLRIIAWQPLPEPYREEQENNGEENE